MKVSELIEELKCFNGNDEVAIKVSNSSYPECIRTVNSMPVRLFWGNEVSSYIIINGEEQIGSV